MSSRRRQALQLPVRRLGQITDPGAAIMDTAFPLLAEAWGSAVLGPQLERQLAPLVGKFAVRYCGAGSLSHCRALLWAAMTRAGDELAATQGTNPADWRSSAGAEAITFIPGILPYRMRYTNRPTGIQQVLSFDGHVPGDA